MSYDAKFVVKDDEANPIGGSVFYEEYLKEDFEQGELDGVVAGEEGLTLEEGGNSDYYNYGVENVEWVEGYDDGTGNTRTKEIDHLFIRAVSGSIRIGSAWVTNVKVDLTDIAVLKLYRNLTTNQVNGNAYCWLLVSAENKGVNHTNADKASSTTASSATTTHILDVSDLTGEYYIAIHCRMATHQTRYRADLKAYHIWGEDSEGNIIERIIESGSRLSLPQDLTSLGTNPGLRAGWQATEPEGTDVTIETAVTGETAHTGEVVGAGDGVENTFYLKHYPAERRNDLIVYVDEVATTEYTRPDANNPRKIVFNAGHEPGDGLAVTADYTGVNTPAEAQGEVQTLYLGSATGGTFTLGNGMTNTDPIAYDATATAIQTALEGIYGEGKVTVEIDTDFTITFVPAIGDSGLAADFTNLSGATDPALTLNTAYDPGDWEEQSYGAILTNTPAGDPTGKHLWIRQELETLDTSITPTLRWFAVNNGHFAIAKVTFEVAENAKEILPTDALGEATFTGLAPDSYDYIVRGMSTQEEEPYNLVSGTIIIVNSNITKNILLAVGIIQHAVNILVPLALGSGFALAPAVITLISPVTGVSVYPSAISLEPGSVTTVRARINPSDITDDRINWATSDNSIASVTGYGLNAVIRANVEGTATITATTIAGGFKAICQVTVAEKEAVSYEALKILSPNFGEVETIKNTEIVDLTISKELSGHHGLEFTLPVGATGWNEIKRGRYIEAEGQKYYIEQIRPERGSDGNPLISVSCTHIFFEIERDNMPHTTSARATIMEHLDYVLRGTGITVVATDKDNAFYNIEREIPYYADESRFEAYKRVFSIFGGHYRLDGFTVEIIPPRPPLLASAVVLEYAVTNESIKKTEDDSDVVTVLYATGGEMEGSPLTRTVYASPEIRALYRRDRVKFVSFGDIKVWNNFVYVTDQWLEKRQLPRTTYNLSVAELKRISNIAELYPGRDFEINIGKVVQVKDTELGINVNKLLQRYAYRPLESDSLSSVIVGDKPFDIGFEEVGYEGTVGEEEGEWRYDEETGEWIFFPDEPGYDDDEIGEDYVLAITEHPDSYGPAGLRYRYHTGANAYEKSTLTIESGAEADGSVTIILNGELCSVTLTAEDTPAQVAAKIAARDYPGWTAEGGMAPNDNQVVFTATAYGTKKYSAEYRFGLTGAVGYFRTVKGREDAFTSDWENTSLPFEKTFAAGDVVEVIAESDNHWFSPVEWYGDGEGFSPRIFTMTGDRSAQVRFASTAPSILVQTNQPSNLTEDTAQLNGVVYDVSRYGNVDRGFVWSFDLNPTLEDNDGVLTAGSGEVGSFSATLNRDTSVSPSESYYHRAYAKVYDNECKRDVVEYGTVRVVNFADISKTQWEVTIEISALDGAPVGEEVKVTPFIGAKKVDAGSAIELKATMDSAYTFKGWEIIDSKTLQSKTETANPHSLTVDRDYTIVAKVTRQFMTVALLQQGGTGYIQWAPATGGARETRRLQTQILMVPYDVHVWVVPDDKTMGYEWEENTPVAGEGREPRLFRVADGHQTATVVFKPGAACEARCIFISPNDPDNSIGEDGNVWLKYRE